METVEIILRIALVLVSLALIVLVLLQQGKGANMGAAFGSGASQTMFGSAGASGFLTKIITWLAVAFFVITFGLAYTARQAAEAAGTTGIPTALEDGVPAVVEEAPAPVAETDVPEFEIQVESGAGDDVPSVEFDVEGESEPPTP